MKEAIEALLAKHEPIHGLAGWIVRLADQSMVRNATADWLKPAQTGPLLTRLIQAAEALESQKAEPLRICWRFEQLRVYLGRRPDGNCLVLFLENQDNHDTDKVETVLSDFLLAAG